MYDNSYFENVPGFTTATETVSNRISWGPERLRLVVSGQISGAARDAGGTPTSLLRSGLLLGMVAASGLLKEYSGTATDGTDIVYGVLCHDARVVDRDGNNQNKWAPVMIGGPVLNATLIGLDENARSQMIGRFIFDDRGYVPNLFGYQRTIAKATNYTVVNGTDNNTVFTTRGASGTVTFTLPTTLKKGQKWTFINEAGQTMTIAAPANKLVAFNNLTATSITFSTASELIGSGVTIIVNDNETKYIAIPLLGSETATPTIA